MPAPAPVSTITRSVSRCFTAPTLPLTQESVRIALEPQPDLGRVETEVGQVIAVGTNPVFSLDSGGIGRCVRLGVAERDAEGNITSVAVTYPDDFTGQMLRYSEQFSFLPDVN